MSRSRLQNVTVTLHWVVAPPDVRENSAPVLTEQNLADPDESVDAAMDYRLPSRGSPEILRQAQRCLLLYIGWLVDEAPAQYPSWAKDELQRAMRRLVEVEAVAESACPHLH
jgi:hypothetical protein